MKKLVINRKAKVALLTFFGLFIAFLCIPVPRFDKPYSTVLTAKNGESSGVFLQPTTIPRNTSPAFWNTKTVGFSSIQASILFRS